ncbi:inhibin beta chain isoform X2 [Drosophila bipectinata]|uniref:inhibin beta chain isoform X2 n=1 Tax=Drosophila bipectinata TaxID=42026 RepID=UPI0038B3CD3A
MRFSVGPHQSQNGPPFKGNRCFYNCQCICCRQGCCVVFIDSCCCCFNFNSCNCYGGRTKLSHTQQLASIKVPGTKSFGFSNLMAIFLVLVRWVTALTTLLSSCILLDSGAGLSPSGISGERRPSNKTISVAISNAATANNNSIFKLRSLHSWYSLCELTNDEQLKSKNFHKMFCNNRNIRRQRRRKRRRRRRRRRYTKTVFNKQLNIQRHQKLQEKLHIEHVELQHDTIFQQRLSFGEATCSTFKIFKVNYKLVSGVRQLYVPTTKAVKVSPLKYFLSTNISMRSCSKNKRNRCNLIWLLIGLVWFEIKLINCNGISSSNYFVSNSVNHKGCAFCHEGGKTHIYNNKDNAPTEYNIYNKYNNNNNFYKKTNKQHYNISPGDLIRLESIKRQILTKLGLTHKPNVSNPLPKQFIWETIYRADGDRIINNAFENINSKFRQKSSRLNENDGTSQHASISRFLFINSLNSNKSNRYEKSLENYRSFRQGHQGEEFETKKIFNKSWSHRPWQMSTHIWSQSAKHHSSLSSKVLQRSGESSASKSFNDISITKSNASPFSKSTYLININPSSDSSDSIHEKNDAVKPNDHEYFNDYSVQSPYKNQDPETTKSGYYRTNTNIFSSNMNMEKLKQRYSSAEFNDHENFEQEDFFGNTQEIITFAETGNTKWRKKKTRHKIKIWIFQLAEGINITEKGIDHSITFRASFEVNTKLLGWKKFDLTKTIREWYTQSKNEKLRLLIDCTGCGDRYSIHSFQPADLNNTRYSNSNRPFLVLHTESLKKRRIRRRAVDCGGASNGQCCKESFYVSFKALGWDDWIIAPRGYFANYCRGDCTGSFRTPDTFQTFHAHFIEEYRKMGLLNGMRPCCAPIKFSSMSLIYYGDDGIIKRDLPKMVVDECGCP